MSLPVVKCLFGQTGKYGTWWYKSSEPVEIGDRVWLWEDDMPSEWLWTEGVISDFRVDEDGEQHGHAHYDYQNLDDFGQSSHPRTETHKIPAEIVAFALGKKL